MSEPSGLTAHYGGGGFIARIDDALAAAGLDADRLTPSDLAALDHFHARGLLATRELAEAVQPQAHERVIDVGSGLGGPSRYLAYTHECRVSGIDLSPSFVEAATYLSERLGISDKVDYQCGNALSLPFTSESFDIAWTQHVAMNIADRDGLYGEVFRVLRPGGRFAIYDVVARDGTDIVFPVPWSRTAQTSFLLSEENMRSTLLRQGFSVSSWADRSDAAISWYAEQQAARANRQSPAVNLQLAMGPEFPAMSANFGRNLREGRIGLVQAVMTRP
jgi:sarcosine/dimethylglycine N-methyltransferase